jgi:hypothetical protein
MVVAADCWQGQRRGGHPHGVDQAVPGSWTISSRARLFGYEDMSGADRQPKEMVVVADCEASPLVTPKPQPPAAVVQSTEPQTVPLGR